MRRLLLFAGLAASLVASAAAQTPGSCQLGTAQADLATPDLFARLFNTGSLFYGNDTDGFDRFGYIVPRNTGNSPVYAANLWFGGRVGGEVRTAAATYGPDFNFWPGPLGGDGRPVDPADCSAYDRIYVVAPDDVAEYDETGAATADLAAWPVGLGAPSVRASGQPVVVTGRTQVLNLAAGERPVVRGGPTAFWVMNDVGNTRRALENGTVPRPMGIEVQATAFLPAAGPATLRQTTVYRITTVNRGAAAISDFRIGLFADPDLGDGGDDYQGADSTRGMGYVYNGPAIDGEYGIPPAIGFDLLSGAYAGPPVYKAGPRGTTGEPLTPVEFQNRLRGLWGDGTVVRAFDIGYQQTQGDVTRYTFPGDPVTGQPWTEVNPGSGLPPFGPDDRRVMIAAPATVLAPGSSHTVDLAVVFAQGTSNLASVTSLRTASDVVQAAYDAGTLFAGTTAFGPAPAPVPVAPAEGAHLPGEEPVVFEWAPVAGADRYLLDISSMPNFASIQTVTTEATTLTLPVSQLNANQATPFYWRVRTITDRREGAPSAARAFTAYRYVEGPLTLASGAPAIVETTAPGGGLACAAGSTAEGCDEVSGDLVFRDPNSTGDYAVAGLSTIRLGELAPNDFEIRFTAQGSVAVGPSFSDTSERLFRVPFEAWDVGATTPGQPNDPSDDQQLVLHVFTIGCSVAYDQPTRLGIGLTTARASAYYATDSYAAFAATAAPLVAADPAGCPAGATVVPATEQVDRARDEAIRNVAFEQTGARALPDLAGSTVRFYSLDRVAVASEGGASAPRASQLGAAFPNPARASLTVPYTLAAAGPVRLRLVDVLGRTVAILADGPQAAGAHEARIDTRTLAAGVYAVVLEAGDARSTRTVTVVR